MILTFTPQHQYTEPTLSQAQTKARVEDDRREDEQPPEGRRDVGAGQREVTG